MSTLRSYKTRIRRICNLRPTSPRTGVLSACCLIAIAAFVPASASRAGDWPGFRGVDGQGIAPESTTLTQSEAVQLDVAWKTPIGSGYSGVAIADGRAVTMFSDGTNDVAASFDAKTGKEQWRYTIDATYKGHDGSHTGPITTPCLAADHVIGLSPRGRLFGLDAATGKLNWSTDLVKDHGAKKPHYGFSTSPIFAEGVLVVQVGGAQGAIMGFDPTSGKRLWSAGEDGVQYQSPVALTGPDGKTIVVAASDKKLLAVVPNDGTVLWDYDHGGNGATGAGSITPVPAGTNRFFIAHKGNASSGLSVSHDGDTPEVTSLWESRTIRNSYNVPVYQGGYVYAYSSRFLTCVDAKTGESAWRSRAAGDGFTILVDGHLVIASKDGTVHVARATPEGYAGVTKMQVCDELIWAPPSFADGSIFVRSMGELARIDIHSKQGGITPEPTMAAAKTKFDRFLRTVEAATDKTALVDRFMKVQNSFPIIEGDNMIHFVYRGEATDVAVAGDVIGGRQERVMTRLAGTDLFHCTVTMEPDARTNYVFIKDYEQILDPRNDRATATTVYGKEMQIFSGEGAMPMSWVSMPKWHEPKHLVAASGGIKGRLDTIELDSKALEAKVTVNVYVPAGYEGSKGRFPVAYVHNGKDALERGKWVTTLDNICGKNVQPMLVAFFSNPTRGKGKAYAEMFATELVPLMDSTYRTIASAEGRASIGMGFPGVTALAVALSQPGVVGKVGLQSLFMFGSMRAPIDEHLKTASEQPITIYQEWGKYDLRNPQEAWDLAQTNRDLAKELRDKGYDPRGGEVHDGTGWSSWSLRTDVMLKTLFPKG